MGRTIISVLSVCLVGVMPATAFAQEDARAHFQRGQAAYETGDYETAAQEWQRAYELDARPALQYNLAQAYERLGRLDDAVRAYHTYIDNTTPDDPRMETARARLASLEQRVSQTSVHLTGGIEGAAIFIDGQDRGRLPHPDPLRVEPGSHRIVVRADGYEDFVSVVAVSPGRSAEVPIELRPGVSGGASTGGGGISPIGIIVAGVGAAALIGGAITGGLALSSAGDAPSDTSPQADDARTLALVTDVLLPVGAAAAITGVILMFVLQDGAGGSASESAQVVPVLGPTYAGVAVSQAF